MNSLSMPEEAIIMAKCPSCGKEVGKPVKEWDVGKNLHVKMYECCGKKFRETSKK
jgi:hypothetical protein